MVVTLNDKNDAPNIPCVISLDRIPNKSDIFHPNPHEEYPYKDKQLGIGYIWLNTAGTTPDNRVFMLMGIENGEAAWEPVNANRS